MPGTDRYGPHDQTKEFQTTISQLARERRTLLGLVDVASELADAVRPVARGGSLARALEAWDQALGHKEAA